MDSLISWSIVINTELLPFPLCRWMIPCPCWWECPRTQRPWRRAQESIRTRPGRLDLCYYNRYGSFIHPFIHSSRIYDADQCSPGPGLRSQPSRDPAPPDVSCSITIHRALQHLEHLEHPGPEEPEEPSLIDLWHHSNMYDPLIYDLLQTRTSHSFQLLSDSQY